PAGGGRRPSLILRRALLHASRHARAKAFGRDGWVDTRRDHRLALWTPAQSGLLEHPSHRELVGAGSRGHLARPGERYSVSLWRWQPRRQTRHQESGGAERAHKQTSPLVFWPALRVVDGGVGRLSPPRGLSAHFAEAPHGLSQ